MLKRNQFAALQIIREWTTDDVLVLLANHGLSDCCEAFRKRDIDGEALLVLTEGKLALWKRDIGNTGVSKLAKLVQNVKDQPEKYVGIGKTTNSQSTHTSAASDVSSAPVQQKEWVSNQINTPSSLSDSGSWDTDFEDEEENNRNKGTSVSQGSRNGWRTNSNNAQSRNNVNQVPTGRVPNGIGTDKLPDLVDSSESAVEYMNLDEESFVDEKPTLPSRPPVLGPKPTSLGNATSNKACSLPKPPSVNENNLSHVKNLISNLTAPSPAVPEDTQYDEEYIYYEEYEEQKSEHVEEPEEEYIYYDEQEEPKAGSNVQELSALLNQSLRDRFQKCGLKSLDQDRPPIPPPCNTKPKIQFPQDETPPTPPRPQPRQAPVEADYESDEYESIQEHQPVVLENLRIPGRNLGIPNPTASGTPPPLPEKPWNKTRDSPSPVRLQTPPRRKSDDSSVHSSPGNSADGVSGLFGVFRKVINRPSTYATPATQTPYPEREKTPTPEPKKAAPAPVPSQKPPPVEQRLPQSNNRPLPPTPEGKNLQLPDKSTAPAPRKTSKVGLTQQPWYHNVDRKKAEEMLRNAEDGCFMVRPSSQAQNPLTLTLWYKNRLYNISIRHRPDGRYALGTEKQNEQSFTSVEEMVQNYHSEKLLLYSGGERTGRTLLTTSPARASSS